MTYFNTSTSTTGGFTTRTVYFNLDQPMLSHRGPVEFSTCTDLAVVPQVCWDVNGYYRDLGVDWRSSRVELRRAYLDGGGPASTRKTYCLKQLLNPGLRRAYDRAPLGARLIDDYVFAEIKRAAINDLARRRADPTDDEALLAAMAARGIRRENVTNKVGDLDDTPDEVVDDGPDGVQDEASAREPDAEDVGPTVYPWYYAYYLWGSGCRDTDRLREWQELLVVAFRERGLVTRLAVGFHGRSAHPWFTYAVGYRLVVFLHHDETPTAEAARAVADRVVQDTQPARTSITER